MSIKPSVLFILSDAYSGSTVLDLLLGSHSRAVGVGEIDAESWDGFFDQNQICTCLFKARECYFWKKVLGELKEMTGHVDFRIRADGTEQMTANTAHLFCAIRSVTGAEIIVDSSKRLQRTRLLAVSSAIETRVIHLIRDGRGVAYSRAKRGEPFEQALRNWTQINHEIAGWLASPDAPPSLRVRYEDLCAMPVQTLSQICKFMGLDWEPGMLQRNDCTHHNVRGNPMRFCSGSAPLSLDEHWKSKLGSRELELFAEMKKSESRLLFGYQ